MCWIDRIKTRFCKHDFEIIDKKISPFQALIDDSRVSYRVTVKCKKLLLTWLIGLGELLIKINDL